MNSPLWSNNFNEEDISEKNIRIVEGFTGIKFSEVEVKALQTAGRQVPSIIKGLDAIEKLIWFDHKEHLGSVLDKISKLIPEAHCKIKKTSRKFGVSSKPPIKIYSDGGIIELEIYKLEYSLGDENNTYCDCLENEDRNKWLITFFARLARYSPHSFIPFSEDVESIYILCTSDKFKAYYPEWEQLAQLTFDANMPDVNVGSFKSLPLQKPLAYKVFYKSILYSMIGEKAAILSYSGNTNPPIGEKVKQGQSIAEAINENLKKTYNYNGSYEVKSFAVNNTALDNNDIRTLRFMSVIKLLDPLDMSSHPFGYRLSWNQESGNNFEEMQVLHKGSVG